MLFATTTETLKDALLNYDPFTRVAMYGPPYRDEAPMAAWFAYASPFEG